MMMLLLKSIIVLIISKPVRLDKHAGTTSKYPKIPDTYQDIFTTGHFGKPTLGTTQATCWARGGICTDIRHCPDLKIDTTIPGCNQGYRVCCKVLKFGSPTIGPKRKSSETLIFSSNLDELDSPLIRSLALKNTRLCHDIT